MPPHLPRASGQAVGGQWGQVGLGAWGAPTALAMLTPRTHPSHAPQPRTPPTQAPHPPHPPSGTHRRPSAYQRASLHDGMSRKSIVGVKGMGPLKAVAKQAASAACQAGGGAWSWRGGGGPAWNGGGPGQPGCGGRPQATTGTPRHEDPHTHTRWSCRCSSWVHCSPLSRSRSCSRTSHHLPANDRVGTVGLVGVHHARLKDQASWTAHTHPYP
jgi:hypothetical protein